MDFIWEAGAEMIAIGLGAIITWCVAKVSGKQIEKNHRDALHSAIITGIGYARSKLTGGGAAVDEKQIVIQTKEWVHKSVPDALKHFGLDKASDRLIDMIAAKVNL